MTMLRTAARYGLLFVLLVAPGLAAATDAIFPGAGWERADPAALGWSVDKLKEAEAYAGTIGSTAVMIVQDGRVVAAWGQPDRKVVVHSVRKSIISALYGMAVAEKRIDLGKTLAELRIDDKPPSLTEEEKRATVRDLLMARSGVYHEAAAETRPMKEARPKRGSHPSGAFWYYNNWDFNALGTIYQQATGQNLFATVEQRLARPIGMEDFSAGDGAFGYEPTSEHPAYRMAFTARDLARFGWLYLNLGRWEDRQIVPADWVAESTRPHSDAQPGVGYGYLWWASKKDRQFETLVGPGAYSARGAGGQYVLVVPAHRMVVVHLYDTRHRHTEANGRIFGTLLTRIMAAAPMPAHQ